MDKFRHLITQIIRFGFVGGLCFLIDYGLLALFTEVFSIHYMVSAALSFAISTAVNYLLSMRFVFSGKEGMRRSREFTIFFVLSIIGLGVNQLMMWLGSDICGIHYLIVKIGATAVVMVFNFVTRKILLDSK